jgi:hypothetical protein
MLTGIYIDDSGNPGKISASKYDSKNRKTWIALILTPEERLEANMVMEFFLDKLKKEINATEFHFTDIYSGNGQFKDLGLDIRLDMFETFAGIYELYKYPLLMQTLSSEDIPRNKLTTNPQKKKYDGLNLNDSEDLALCTLLFKIKKFLQANPNIPRPVEIIIDQGRQKPNTVQHCSMLGNMLYNQEIQYKSSFDDPLLQLVDFSAFAMNRNRWILCKEDKNELDIELLRIFSQANFNISGIKRVLVAPKSDTIKIYDGLLKEAFDKNKDLDNLSIEELIKRFNE